MKVRVRLFASLREVVGLDDLEVDLDSGTTVQGLWEHLVRRNGGLAPYGGSLSFAVNHDFVSRDSELKANDEVAFLPPVSGG